MKAISSVEEGIQLIDSFQGRVEEFRLVVPNEMLDEAGMTMAVLTDHVLARGWLPNGVSRIEGHCVFRYQVAS